MNDHQPVRVWRADDVQPPKTQAPAAVKINRVAYQPRPQVRSQPQPAPAPPKPASQPTPAEAPPSPASAREMDNVVTRLWAHIAGTAKNRGATEGQMWSRILDSLKFWVLVRDEAKALGVPEQDLWGHLKRSAEAYLSKYREARVQEAAQRDADLQRRKGKMLETLSMDEISTLSLEALAILSRESGVPMRTLRQMIAYRRATNTRETEPNVALGSVEVVRPKPEHVTEQSTEQSDGEDRQ